MAKYRIAWLPGDGVGGEVLQAARIVLDRLELDAEYLPGDIGWEFWCQEGDPLPVRTIELLKQVDAALFGAITSKPAREARQELAPELRAKGLVYRSPIVRMRQLFDLYVCLRPCRAFAGNPINTREGIDLVIFRENTEDLYAGVEFHPVPRSLSHLLAEISPSFAPFKGLASDQFAISCKINSRQGSERIIRAAFQFARDHRRKRVTVVHKANVVRATDGLFLEAARRIAAFLPRHSVGPRQRGRHGHVAAQEPPQLRRPGRSQPVRGYRLGPVRPDGGWTGVRLLRQYRRPAGRLRADPRIGPQVRGTVQGKPHRNHSGRQNDAGLSV